MLTRELLGFSSIMCFILFFASLAVVIINPFGWTLLNIYGILLGGLITAFAGQFFLTKMRRVQKEDEKK